MGHTRRAIIYSVSSLVLMLASRSVLAQETGASSVPASRADSVLSDIVVTARRREESAQTVPVSVVAFGAEALKDRQIQSMSDLTTTVPGMRFTHQGGGQNINIVLRGLQRIPLNSATNAVITYFGDIPLSATGSNVPTYDLANIQVLKGPQGTLFGRSSIGGAVVITPQAPTYEFEGYGKGSFGNLDFRDIEGALNVPLIADKAAIRFAGKLSRRDGYTKNLGVGGDLADVHQNSFRASLLLEPTETLRSTTIFDYFKANENGTGNILVAALSDGLIRVPQLASFFDCHAGNAFNPAPCVGFSPGADIDDALLQQKAWGARKTISEFAPTLERRIWGVSNKTELDIGSLTLRNIVGYRKTAAINDDNSDAVAFQPLSIINASSRTREKQLSEEFQILGNALDDRLNYIFGLFYIKESPSGLNGSFFPVAASAAPWVVAYTTRSDKAVFGQVGYDLSNLVNGLKATVGYRYTQNKQSVCAITPPTLVAGVSIVGAEPPVSASQCATASFDLPGGGTQVSTTTGSSDNVSTYNIGLDWQVSPDVFTYVVHHRGYRAGGINAPAFDTPATLPLAPYQTYRPETLTDFEVGLKTRFELSEVKGRFNVALYRSTYKNVVTAFNTSGLVPADDAGAPQFSSIGINTGSRRLSGFESEFVIEPFGGFSISNTAAYTHQKILESSLPPVAGLQAPSLDPSSPKWSTTTSLRWVLPVRPLEGDLLFNASYYWQGKYFVSNDQLPSYDVVNARLDWDGIAGSGLNAALFMRNVLDKTYPYAGGVGASSIGIYTRSYAEPRIYGIELGYRF